MRFQAARCVLAQVLAATCFIFVSVERVTSAQEQKKSHREISFNKLEKQYNLEEGRVLTVIANNIGATGVICIQRLGNLGSVQMKACAVIYIDNQNAKSKIPRIERVVPMPDAAVSYNSGTLTIDGQATPQRRVVIYLGLPSNTEVTLFANGQMVGSGTTANVLAQNGKILAAQENYSFQAAVMQAISIKNPNP
jgi:hypothetical protein